MLASNCYLIVPTYNAGTIWQSWIDAVLHQQVIFPAQVLVIDSSSTDNTLALAQQAGFRTHSIAKKDFNHGATRNLAFTLCPDAQILIFLTQDAILATDNSIEALVAAFEQEAVAVVFGRQLPHTDATRIAAHARLFNYPAMSYIRCLTDVAQYGIKTVFCSNSFAAYRRECLEEIGGFPNDVILSEDTYVAAKLVKQGYLIAYHAQAAVYHSHNYSLTQEFRRYFDIGVFHAQQPWIRNEFGAAEGEGKKFVLSELAYLWQYSRLIIPQAMLRTLFKWLGYRLGIEYQHLPRELCKRFSMHRGFWL
jgi:rhamnosyltransferase